MDTQPITLFVPCTPPSPYLATDINCPCTEVEQPCSAPRVRSGCPCVVRGGKEQSCLPESNAPKPFRPFKKIISFCNLLVRWSYFPHRCPPLFWSKIKLPLPNRQFLEEALAFVPYFSWPLYHLDLVVRIVSVLPTFPPWHSKYPRGSPRSHHQKSQPLGSLATFCCTWSNL